MIGRGRPLLALLLWGLVIALGGALIGGGETVGQGLNHASLIIEFPDGRTETLCVEFSEEEISGEELLRRSGLSVVVSSFGGLGGAVCRIGDVGCSDPGNCFCQCQSADCESWIYYTLADGEWRWQPTGASTRMLRDGDADAWVWGARGDLASAEAAGDAGCASNVGPSPPATAAAMQSDTLRPSATVRTQEQNEPGPTRQAGASAGLEPVDAATAQAATAEATRAITTASGEAVRADPETEDGTGEADTGDQELELEEESGGGVPTGLIAFGAVVIGLAGVAGAVALRRRLRG